MKISPIILGCGRFGAGIEERASRELVAAARELGVAAFDTADSYAGGLSEKMLGQALGRKRAGAFLITKTGGGPGGSLSAKTLAARCEASLKRLKTDRIDLYLAHRFDPSCRTEELLEAFAKLKRAGKIGAFGLSNFPIEELARAFKNAAPPTAYQGAFSLLERGEESSARLCGKRGAAFLAYSPLAGGLLVRPKEAIGRLAEFDPGVIESRRELLRAGALVSGLSSARAAVGWALSQNGVTSVVVGARTVAQLEDAAAARKLRTRAAGLLERAAPSIPPCERVVEVLLSYACAAKCPFCYNPPLTQELLSRDISWPQAASLLFQRRREGYDGVWFTGGEATQRADLPKLLRLARKLDYKRIQIGTNGIAAASARAARSLAAAGLNYARVSIHSADPGLHDAAMGLPGAHGKAVAAIANFKRQGVAVGLNFVLHGTNAAELPRFLELAYGTWGVEDIDVLFPHYRGMMELNAARVAVSYAQAAPWIERAFELVSSRWPKAPRPRLINFPPCALPEPCRPWARDWRREDCADHSLAQPQGRVSELQDMKAGQKRQGAECASCRLADSCMGFESAYAERFGEAEFSPLREDACLAR